jgi:hypothetical protein
MADSPTIVRPLALKGGVLASASTLRSEPDVRSISESHTPLVFTPMSDMDDPHWQRVRFPDLEAAYRKWLASRRS